MRALPAMAVLAFLVPLFAGCTTAPPPEETAAPSVFKVVGNGQPVPFALVAAFHHPWSTHNATPPIRILNADGNGEFRARDLPATTTYVTATMPGLGAGSVSTLEGSGVIELTDALNPLGTLGFKPHVDLLCSAPDNLPNPPNPAVRFDCGAFGEPVVEVAGDGAIWASAVCCIGKAPPIWVSRDGGETFQQLRDVGTGLVRDTYGIEGDFAIDDTGNVYFFDIALAGIWFTSYEADGTHRWTVPVPGMPAVDRPWVRAGAADEVWLFYNAGIGQSHVYASKNGGLTWTPAPVSFPCNFANPGQGPTRQDFAVAAPCDGGLTLFTSHDGAQSFDAGVKVPMPDVKYDENRGRGLESQNAPVVDEAGNVYLFFTHHVDEKNRQKALFMAARDSAGNWSAPIQVGPAGLATQPWPAAGREGHVGVAWYQSEGNNTSEQDARWRLFTAASVDAHTPDARFQWTVADPDVLHQGVYDRSLGDFLQADLTPGGDLVVVYAIREGQSQLTNRFVQTNGNLGLGPDVFLNGPRMATGR